MSVQSNIIFNSSPKPTIGVEVELQTLDSKTLSPIAGAPLLLDKYGETTWLKKELFRHLKRYLMLLD